MEAYRDRARKAIASPTRENVLELGTTLAALHRNFHPGDPVEIALSAELKQSLLSIDGFARIYRNAIEDERVLIAGLPPRDPRRGGYNHLRRDILRGILPLLPTPESIRILGDYLDDERDPLPPPSPSQDWDDLPPNAELASESLMEIGLRDPPVRKSLWPHADTLERQRKWYAEVKSGKRTFSFEGEAVEYRFRPDGTWETLAMANPPDDAPPLPEPKERQAKTRPAKPAVRPTVAGPSAPVWRWGFGAVVLFVGVGWMIWKRWG